MILQPVNNCLLIELSETDNTIALPEKPYSSKTSGIVRAVDNALTSKIIDKFLGKRVYFEEYKDGCQADVGSNKYTFIKLEDVRGYFDEA